MVSVKADDPAPATSQGKRSWIVLPARRFLAALPALIVGFAVLRLGGLTEGWPPGGSGHGVSLVAGAFADDLLALGRYLPALFLVSWPILALPSKRARLMAIGSLWSVLTMAQFGLTGYFLITRVPLGADLFRYSWSEIKTSAAGGYHPEPVLVLTEVVALALIWLVLRWRIGHREHLPSSRATAATLTLSVALFFLAPHELPLAAETEYVHDLRLSKLAAFLDSNRGALAADLFSGPPTGNSGKGIGRGGPILGFRYLDPHYPFLHAEQTPDVLGAEFAGSRNVPPNFVFLIVEGLGRSFSGTGATLGSFTPFLDSLAAHSLYFENFLSGQGRTFAVLPTIFGSLPYGKEGFSALGNRMPDQPTLLSILKEQGYRTRFFCGWDPNFDNETGFLQRQLVDEIYGVHDFGRNPPPQSYWGFEDNDLVSFVLAHEAHAISKPFVDIIQTITMHTPYWFQGQKHYYPQLERRLDELGIPADQRSRYRNQRAIYTSILYTDDALRRYFHEAAKQPWFRNTIFLITGDHRLPEIPEGEWIDRYHVPLIVYSPMLTKPRRVKAISSQFDIAPSVLAFLSKNYGLNSPPRVTWVGSGLDLGMTFRDVHEIPLMQTKATFNSFVHGLWAVSRNALYRLHDGMDAEPAQNPAMLTEVEARFRAFRAANDEFLRTDRLMPRSAATQLASYAEVKRASVVSVKAKAGPTLAISEVRIATSRRRQLAVDMTATNSGQRDSPALVPIAVIETDRGKELLESYGIPLPIPRHGKMHQRIALNTEHVPAGHYYLAVILADPNKGGRVGDGRFHIPITIAP